MADNLERVSRRRFVDLAGRAILFGGAVSLLGISTAWAAQSVDCPIYMFHAIAPGGAVVDRVIRDNARLGRIPVSVRQLSDILLGEAAVPDRPLFCLTFDDGTKDQFDNALPVLNRYEAEATFFVMGTAWQGDGVHRYMTAEQLRHMAGLGYEVASHTVTHRSLSALSVSDPNACDDEVYQSKSQLEVVIDDRVVSFCFPNGSYNQGVINRVIDAGYTSAASEINGRIQSDVNRYLLRRVRPS